MTFLALCLFLLVGSAFLSLFLASSPRLLRFNVVFGAATACILGAIPAFQTLLGGVPPSVSLPWSVPYASFSLRLDALSSFFLLPVLGIPALCALYGTGYLTPQEGKKKLHIHWFFYQLLTASMVIVLCSRNAVLFLAAWEAMTLTSYFLVTFDDHKEGVRRAGWIYLVAAHFGTAFLTLMFLGLGAQAGSFEFDVWKSAASGLAGGGLFFAFAVLGFGVKAGFVPLHLWLPEAHPAAPSHVSAVMSGVMIKTGIYGILRTLEFVGPPASSWGWALIAVGATSGIFGVLFALAQKDLKRLLAYSSVENIGIITLGVGVGLLGLSYDRTDLALLGFAGALLHVLNHSVFKGLLFLGAGTVLHEAKTLDLDRLGGLSRKMPRTAWFFAVGAVAIVGLPPLNGFLGEFLIYTGSFRAVAEGSVAFASAGIIVLTVLALIGGLALACFTRAFGTAFLGEARDEKVPETHDPGRAMLLPMGLLAVLCLGIGLASPLLLPLLKPVLADLSGWSLENLGPVMADMAEVFWIGSGLALVFLAVLALAYDWKSGLVRRHGSSGGSKGEIGTWDCGYAAPTPRMQYTATSFGENFTSLFSHILRSHLKLKLPQGLFPSQASFHSETPDPVLDALYRPILRRVEKLRGHWNQFQQGRIQVYLLYIALTLFALLVWGWWNP